jgi:hypothetical protein
MQKKKFDLTSDIINVDFEEIDNEKVLVQNTKKISDSKEHKVKKPKVLITMAVDEELRKEYKMWCTRKGLKMAEAFLKGYELLKKSDYS